MLRRFNRIGWTHGQLLRICFHCLQHFSDSTLQLRIFAINYRRGVVLDDDVWINAMPPITDSALAYSCADSGTNTCPPSSSGPRPEIPTTPPHGPFPINGPRPAFLN